MDLHLCDIVHHDTTRHDMDHVKHVNGCTTLTCHVYNLVYYKVMTNVVCHM
jgi:hypothetical protein